MKKIKLAKTLLCIGAIAGLSGCSSAYKNTNAGTFDVTMVPPLQLLNINQLKDADLDLDFKISDRQVYKLTFLLEDTLRKKVKQGRVGEEAFSALQVTFAAFGAAFAASTGVHPDVVISLSGLSALMPDIAGIVSAGDKAKAYSQGLDLIEGANAAYISARSQAVNTKAELISKTELTNEGAVLFVTVMSSLKVMRDALLATIPNPEDLAKAMGKYAFFGLNESKVEIKVAASTELKADSLSLKDDAASKLYTQEVIVLKGGKLKMCSSSSPNIVHVDECAGHSKITIVPKALTTTGEVKVTAVSENGQRTTFTVTVTK
jgi:hypothetical protein